MIREDGIYVLAGSKPMSSFPIEDSGFPETEEEIKRSYQLYLSEIQDKNLKDLQVPYEEFAEHCYLSSHLHHKRLWDAVKEKISSFVGPRYRFVVRRNPYGERRKSGLFINIPNMIAKLRRHYHEFAREYGTSFDPETILDEISNEDSVFWNKVFTSNYLLGILFGYGHMNAYEFDWRSKHALSMERLQIKGQEEMPLMKQKITIKDLRLPNISVYSVTDKKLEKYRHERESIIKEFDGKDFEKIVKAWLSEGISKDDARR